MAFNAQSAISYNNACNYPSNTIKIILDAVSASSAYGWDTPGVTAVSQYQTKKQLDNDGMVGLKTLNKIIADLTGVGKFTEVSAIKAFIAEAQAKQAAAQQNASSIISEFKQPKLIYPFRFEKEMAPHPQTKNIVPSWAARGTFEVVVKLNPNLSTSERLRYEYRQYIKGTALIKDGSRDSKTKWWTQSTPVRVTNIGQNFAIPLDPVRPGSGLTPHYKEDGKIAEDITSTEFRFGYRSIERKGNRFQNLWSPHPVTGHKLTVRDSPGYGEPYQIGLDPNIQMNFTFRGVVVEVAEEDDAQGNLVFKVVREIMERTWNYTFQGALDWDNAVPAVKDTK